MRKAFFLFGLFLLFAFNLFSQEQQKKSPWYIGVSAGPLFGDLENTSISYKYSDKLGFQTGGFIGINLKNEFSVQLEALFERRNFKSERYVTSFRFDDTVSQVCWECYYAYDVDFVSDFLTFPLIVNYSKSKNRFGIVLQGGLYFSFLLINNYDGYEELYLDSESADMFISYGYEPGMYRIVFTGPSEDVMTKYDAGLILGLSGKYKLNQNLFFNLEARLDLSFTGMYENPQMELINYKSFILRTGFGYFLNKKH